MGKKLSWDHLVEAFIIAGKYDGFIHRSISSSKDLSRNMVLASNVASAIEIYWRNGTKVHPRAMDWWAMYRVFTSYYRDNQRWGLEGFPDVDLDSEEFERLDTLPENQFKIPHGSVD